MCTELNKIVGFITYKNEKLNNIYKKTAQALQVFNIFLQCLCV